MKSLFSFDLAGPTEILEEAKVCVEDIARRRNQSLAQHLVILSLSPSYPRSHLCPVPGTLTPGNCFFSIASETQLDSTNGTLQGVTGEQKQREVLSCCTAFLEVAIQIRNTSPPQTVHLPPALLSPSLGDTVSSTCLWSLVGGSDFLLC